ncbi:DUF6612 family protein [Paenibacillus chartarius]|uniref:DUF6612 family protein n=1 Tax=Paenibacillus chartarius TaxID=747481 RepID=A0ABV6DGS5_9BACL
MRQTMKHITAVTVLASSLLVPAIGHAADAGPVTRGEFIRLIAERLELSPKDNTLGLPKDVAADSEFANAVRVMMERKILQGYEDGTFRLSQPVTDTEASYILGRLLGVRDGDAAKALPERFGAAIGGAGNLSAESAQQLVDTALKSDESALEWLKKAAEKQKEVVSFRTAAEMDMTMAMKAFSDNPAMTVDMKASSKLEFHIEQGLHQAMETEMVGPTGPVKIQMNQYTVTSGTYVEMNDPATGKLTWFDMTKQMPYSFEQLIEMQKNSSLSMENWTLPGFFYRDHGTETVDGVKLRKVEMNGSLTSFKEIMDIYAKVSGGTNSGMTDTLKAMPGFEDLSLKMSGVVWIDETSMLIQRMDMDMVMSYGDNSVIPISEVAMSMDMKYADYNGDVEVKLPEAAKQAVPLPMPTAGAGS